MTAEQDWLDKKAAVKSRLQDLLDSGLSLETAKYVAAWNPTYEFDNFSDTEAPASYTAVPENNFSKDLLRLYVSRSGSRTNKGLLEDAALDAGKLYAIFIDDIPSLGIDSITFKLNGSPVHTEASVPWDYAGTAVDGSAQRLSFAAGDYTITANIISASGNFAIEAAFSVE